MKINIGDNEVTIDETTFYIKNPSSSSSPALQLEQLDNTEPLFKFISAAEDGQLTKSIVNADDTTSTSVACYILAEVQDDGNQVTNQDYFLPLYTLSSEAAFDNSLLIEWTESEAYQMLSTTWDSDGVISSATVKWPDGSSGTFSRVAKNSTWLAIDSYDITHTDSGKTVSQSSVTRDSDGLVTTKPELTISEPT